MGRCRKSLPTLFDLPVQDFETATFASR